MSGAVVSAEVSRSPEGHVIVTWTTSGECEKVDLAWGRTPEAVDHGHALTVDAGAGRAIFADLPRGRVYMSVVPSGGGGAVVAAERNLGLSGAVNFRDLGGYPAAGGRRVRWGRVFRSDALLLDDTDLEDLAHLGLRTVYDLRSGEERENFPNRLPDGLNVVEIPLINRSEGEEAPVIDDTDDGEAFLAQLYLHVLDRSAETFASILSGIADEDNLPVVFHCAAGKDRTGMVAALLLAVLGVSEEDIVADYELTSRYRRAERLAEAMERMREQRNIAPEVVAGIMKTPRWALESALEQLSNRHGSVDGYLTGPGGVSPDVPGKLRDLLLEPA
jgi:protein-tyrosine phosphatase